MELSHLLTYFQVFLAAVAGMYLWSVLRGQHVVGVRPLAERDYRRESEKLAQMRRIALTEPLSEKTRPTSFSEIVGQEEGLRALRAALCGPNPQHVLIYGPPGVGKTAAARLVLEEAKRNPSSPFKEYSKFVEIDGATTRFDERGIADPLIGSVHDPIYQGAGPMGMAGIPQPKPGAVTKAHGGVLFIDEIGELHPIQLNKLLKVLEDRRVFLESAYYNPDDPNIPPHIKDMFDNGLPADFRLVGATTRSPEEIPPAIRSRCVEVFFRVLSPEEIGAIAMNAARKIGAEIDPEAVEVIKAYASNGREAVNMVQLAAGLAFTEGTGRVAAEDVEWVVSSGQYAPRPDRKPSQTPQVGVALGLGVRGPNMGVVIEVEATARPTRRRGAGRLTVTGAVEEEEVADHGRKLRRKSMLRSSVENVLTVLRDVSDFDPRDHHIHVNFPGGACIDGPSAGVTIAAAIASAIRAVPVDNSVAMTGEVSVRGSIKPVGGVPAKIEAARRAGIKAVIIPKDNYRETFGGYKDIAIHPVGTLREALKVCLRD